MDFDAALHLIDGMDGSGLELGAGPPVSADFPLEEYRRRYARLTALMDRDGLDAVVFTQEEPVRYFSGYNSVVWAVGRWLPTVLVVTLDPRAALLAGSVFDAGCAAGTSWVTTATYRRPEELPDLIRQHLAAHGLRAVGYEYGPGSTVALPQPIAEDLLAGRTRDGSALFHAVRMLKSPAEVERIRRSVGAATAGYRAGLEAARPGMTEKELVAVICSTMYASGATAGTRPAFVNCVSGRDRYALVDTPAGERSFTAGDVVFVDGGAAADGYVSDILRLIGIGPLRPEDRRYAEVAADATRAMVDAARPGVQVSDLFRVGARSVAASGCTEPVGAVAGHGIGLELWERPLIREHEDPAEDVTLRAGMVLCLEPILAPAHPAGGLAGVFVIEQQVLITDSGCDVLSAGLTDRLWEVGA